jgi:hypothetical protein
MRKKLIVCIGISIFEKKKCKLSFYEKTRNAKFFKLKDQSKETEGREQNG